MAEDNIAIVRRQYELFNEHKIDQAVAQISADCRWEDMATGEVYRGADGYKRLAEMWLTAFPDGRCEIQNLCGSGDLVCCEFRGKGTNTGNLAGPGGEFEPTGKKVEVPFCEVFHVRNGKILSGRSYYDMGSMLKQLGVKL